MRMDILTIGDTTLDVFLHIQEATVSCQLQKQSCLLCLEYAEKIPVESVTRIPGAGNASNAAVGAARLGMKSGIVCIVGNDDIGKSILIHWKKEGVNTSGVRTDHLRATNYSTVLNFKGERTILVYSHPRRYALPTLQDTQWIYYTSLGPGHERLERQLLRHLHLHPSIQLVFNPGGKQLKRGLRSLSPTIRRSDVFIVNTQEAIRLLQNGERTIPGMLHQFIKLGARIAVITDGPKGSYATDGQCVWHCPIFPGPILERTGAGDSYTTGFLFGLFEKKSLLDAMRYGTANAWSVVQRIGPQEGLLTRQGMSTVLRRFSRIQPKRIVD